MAGGFVTGNDLACVLAYPLSTVTLQLSDLGRDIKMKNIIKLFRECDWIVRFEVPAPLRLLDSQQRFHLIAVQL